jgi:signal transduction histidine kinase
MSLAIENARLQNALQQASQEVQQLARRSAQQGWSDYLDGIQRSQRIGYTFDQQQIQPIHGNLSTHPETPPIVLPINVSGEMIGKLQVEPLNNQPWSEEEQKLLSALAITLSQHVDNLRLLDQARYYQQEAEKAVRSLIRTGWQSYTESLSNLGFTYDQERVQPLSTSEISSPQSSFSLPLQIRNEAIGNLILEEAQLDEDTRLLIAEIGERLSQHLESLRLSQQRQQALGEAETLYTIAAQLTAAESIEDILTTICEASQTGIASGLLYTVSTNLQGRPESLILAATWQKKPLSTLPNPIGSRFELSNFPAAQKILQHTPDLIYIEDPQHKNLDELTANFSTHGQSTGSIAVFPLLVQNQWIGVAFLHWDTIHHFSEAEKRLHRSLVRQAAIVLNNRLLLEQSRRRAAELEAVAQLSATASSVLNPHDLLESVVELTNNAFHIYHTQIYLTVSPEMLDIVAASGTIGQRIMLETHPVLIANDQSPVARAAKTRSSILVHDLQDYPNYTPNPLLSNARCELAIPLIVGDRLLGIFDLQSEIVGGFNEESKRTFSTLAAQVAIALQNAELYAQQKATVEKLRELDQMKTAFLANMSHELRTPLNSILGFTDVISLGLDGPTTENMLNDLRLIKKNGEHLLSLINEVLDMAKIEAGKMSLVFEPFKLTELINEAVEITAPLLREKNLLIQRQEEAPLNLQITADRARMRQVFINVIGNAVKFTDSGSINIATQLSGNTLRIEFSDTGIGIPPDKLEMIFESFSQVDSSTTRKVGGTGLGLPISRRLIEMHGGRLWAESTGIPGEGSHFIIELPING